MYREGDWIIEKDTGRVGRVCRKSWCEVSVRFGNAVALRYPEDLELAPLDIRDEDILDMQRLAVEFNQPEWFEELSMQLVSCGQ